MLIDGFKINDLIKVLMSKIQKITIILCHMLITYSRYDMIDIRYANVILGIKISKTSNGLILSQSYYMDKMLKKFNKDDFDVARTPFDTNMLNNMLQVVIQIATCTPKSQNNKLLIRLKPLKNQTLKDLTLKTP